MNRDEKTSTVIIVLIVFIGLALAGIAVVCAMTSPVTAILFGGA